MKEEKVKKNDFVEIKYTGIANGEVFDSNIEEDVKKLDPNFKPDKTIIVIGEKMVLKGLDNALEGKEIGKEYEVNISKKEGFGERKRELLKTIPLSAFTQKKVSPRPGMVLTLDNHIARIVAVSGARVLTDFNNPMAGKDLHYKFKILRKINDIKEKIETLFKVFFKIIPKFEFEDKKIIVFGEKNLEPFINIYKKKFNKLLDMNIIYGGENKKLNKSSKEKTTLNR